MIADILELDYRGLGVAKINGKAWFVEKGNTEEPLFKKFYSLLRHDKYQNANITVFVVAVAGNIFLLNHNERPNKMPYSDGWQNYSLRRSSACR